MDDESNKDELKAQADKNSIAVGGISIGGDVSGNITIGNTGYTVQEVSVLITQIKSTFEPKKFDGRCPYKGLDVFEEEDAELFFGREKLADDLVGRVKESRTVFVTGPSGSGKSSLVRAGLIPALKQGVIQNGHSERWLYETMKPGRDPIGELGRVASSLAGSTHAEDEIRAKVIADKTIFARWCEIALKDGRDKRVVLFIDQFEEAFTQIGKEEERIAFLNLLTHAATAENGRVIILFSMRSDFVSNCATYPQLNALLNQQFIQIGAMQPDELVSAIAQPALRVGLRIDPDLIAQIINDMKGEPGALPLMQFALKDLFDAMQAKGGMIALTLSDYLQRGGIQKSLERHADAAFGSLGVHEQELARSIFSGLIEIGRGTQDTKRTALFDELVPANTNDENVKALVQKLADARLITTDESGGKDTVTISHEKLIDAWPWLKKLINENRDVIALQNEIAADAKEWEERKRDASYLYTGGRLATVREQFEKQKLALSHLAQEFVRAGRARQQRTRAALISAVSLVLIAAIVASVVFQNQAQANIEIANTAQASSTLAVNNAATAEVNANIALSRQLGAQAISLQENELQLSLLLGVEAYKTADTVQARSILLSNVERYSQLTGFLGTQGESTDGANIAISPNGKIAATGGINHSIILWNIEDRQPIGKPLIGHRLIITSMAFTPDGKTLASAGQDGTVILWDIESQEQISQLISSYRIINSIAFSPDGIILAVGGNDGLIYLWNIYTKNIEGTLISDNYLIGPKVIFSPNGKIIATTSTSCSNATANTVCQSKVVLWDSTSLKPVAELSDEIGRLWDISFSPDGKTFASGGEKGIVLWDLSVGIFTPKLIDTEQVQSLDFSPDGKILATGNKNIIFWDLNTQERIAQPLSGHSSSITSLKFSPDGKKLLSGGCNFNANTSVQLCDKGETIIWSMENSNPIIKPLVFENNNIYATSTSPDGNLLVLNDNGKMILWDISSQKNIGEIVKCNNDSPDQIAFSSDGGYIAIECKSNSVIYVWNTSTLKIVNEIRVDDVHNFAFSPNNKLLAIRKSDQIGFWDLLTNKPAKSPLSVENDQWKYTLAFSPDGNTLAATACNKSTSGFYCEPKIILWDIDSLTVTNQLTLEGIGGTIRSIAFSPNGTILASGGGGNGVQGGDSSIILWDLSTGKPIGKPLKPLTGIIFDIYSLSFSPDNKSLVSSDFAGGIIFWDVSTHQVINQFELDAVPAEATFDANSKTLIVNLYGMVSLWNFEPNYWSQLACERAGRNLSRAEWEQYIGNSLPYQAVCPNLPVEPESTPTP